MSLKIYGDVLSGNCYKLKLLMAFLKIPHQWVHIDVVKGESRTPEFLAKNPNGKIPLLELDNGEFLPESNAILYYLASGSPWLPTDTLARARVLQWMFFEQYSHEPCIAVARYINKYLGLPESRRADYESKQAGGHRALAVMEQQLAQHAFLVGTTPTIADIALYAYTHVSHEGGFNLSSYPGIRAWLERMATLPGYVGMTD
ncbi:MAG: hypothetical protein RLZZ385_342 [Pseudomonadota bacterium]|jgi:glutathione S-transferase